MSNLGLEVALASLEVGLVRTQVGDRNVLESMLEEGDSLGGEPSGHIILGEHSLAGDGILTTLNIAQVLLLERRSLAQLSAGLRLRPQVLRSVAVGGQGRDLLEVRKVRGRIESVQESLQGRGRILVRCSGTEPVVRIMAEGEDREHLEECVEGIAAQIRRSRARLAAPDDTRRQERS
jgi:phosphoglucosamine mutase